MQHPSPFDDPEFYENVLVKRAIAFCIDTALIFILCFILLPFTGFLALFVWVPFFAVISFIYRVLTLSYGSATLGMLFLGIEIRDAQDRPLAPLTAALHTVGFYLSSLLTPVQLISFVTMLATSKGQSITDLVLDTVVINKRATAFVNLN